MGGIVEHRLLFLGKRKICGMCDDNDVHDEWLFGYAWYSDL